MEKTIKYLENGEYHYATVKDVGDLAKLKTDSKDDLVTAINELFITGGEAPKKPDGYDELVDNVADAIQKQQQMTDTITNMQQSAQLSDAEMEHMKQVQEELHQEYLKAIKELNEAVDKAKADAADLDKKTSDLQDKLDETFASVDKEVSDVHKQLDSESAGLRKDLDDTKTSLESTRKDLLNNTQEFGVVNSEVKELKDKMDRRIWSTDLDPVREQVNKNTTEVSQTKDELKNKADQSSLDLVTNSVENLSTQVKENADGLKVSVKKDELGGDVARLLNDKTNLLLGTRSFSGEDNWKNRDTATIEPGYYKGLKSAAIQSTDSSIYQPYHIKANTAYTFSFFGKEDKDNHKATLIIKPIDAPNINIDNAEQPVHITTEWQRFAVTFSADQDCDISIQIIQGPEANNNILHLAGFKLQYGQNNTPWEPNEADVAENIEHTESQFNVYSDQIAGIVKKQEKMGDTERQLDTRITETAEGLKQTSKDLQDANGKITEFKGQLESTAQGLKTEYEKYTNDAVGQISDSTLNLIRNSSFQNKDSDFDQWQNISAKANVRSDENGLRWVELTQSGMTTDNIVGLTSNYFKVKQGKVTVAVDIKSGTKADLDVESVLTLELYDENKKRVDFTRLTLNDLGLNKSLLGDHQVHRGLYRLGIDRNDAKYMTVKALLARNGDLYFTNFSARLSSIDDGAYEPNPDDVNHQILKQNTKIEQNAKEVAIKANSVDVTRDIKSAVDGIKVGGTNLAAGTNQEYTMGFGIPNTIWKDGNAYATLPTTGSGNEILPQDPHMFWYTLTAGQEYTQTIWFRTDATAKDLKASGITWFTSDGHDYQPATIQKIGPNSYKLFCSYKWPGKNNNDVRLFDISELRQAFDLNTGTYLKFGKLKLEEGNKSTSWAPAPEDISTEIKSAKDAAIQVASDQINLHVNEISTQFDDKLNKRINEQKTASEKFTSDGIEQTVTKITNVKNDVDRLGDKVDGIQVGGRNYLRDSNKSIFGWAQDLGTMPNEVLDQLAGKTITVSCDVEWNNFTSDSSTQNRLGFEAAVTGSDGKGYWLGAWKWPSTPSGKERISAQWSLPAGVTFTANNNSANGYVSISGTGKVSHAKIEVGNRMTDWSPAPEDTSEEIKSAKEAAIKVSSDKIDLQVQEITGKFNDKLNKSAVEIKSASEKFTTDGIEQTVTKITNVKNDVDRLGDKVDSFGGGVNLVKDTSESEISGKAYDIKDYYFSEPLEPNTKYTISIDAKVDQEALNHQQFIFVDPYTANWSWGAQMSCISASLEYQHYRYTFITPDASQKVTNISVYLAHPDGATNGDRDNLSGTGYFKKLKVEKGEVATPWTPYSQDINKKIDTQTFDSANIDEMRTQGHYFVKNLTGNPVGGWVYVDVTGNNNDRIRQDVYQDSGSKHMYRRWFGTYWTGWEQGAYLSDVNNVKTEVTASVKNLGDRVTTEVNSITTRQNNFENETKAQHSNDVELVRKSDFEDGSKGNWTVTGVVPATNPAPPAELGQSGMKVLQTNARDGYEDGIWYSVKPGEKFDVDFWCAPSSAFHTTFGLCFVDKNKGNWNWQGIQTDQSGQWKHYTGTITAPANASFARPWYQMEKPANNTENSSWIAKPHIRRQNPQVAEKISELNTKWDVANGQIQGKVTETQVNNILNGKGYATTSTVQSLITQKAGTISESITNLDAKYSAKDGVNIQRGTGDCSFTFTSYNATVTIENYDDHTKMFHVKGASGFYTSYNADTSFVPTVGETYTVSADVKGSGTTSGDFFKYEGADSCSLGTVTLTDTWQRISNTVHIGSVTGQWIFYLNNNAGDFYVKHIKIERGSVATPWTPAPSDNATVTQVQSLTASIDGLQSTVANKADRSQITQLSNVIQSKVSSSDFNNLRKAVDLQTLDSADINNMKTNGHYFVHNLANNPVGGWVYVDVTGNGNDRIRQDVYQDNGNKHKYRRWFGSYWTSWDEGANYSEITQLRDDINLRVKSGDLLSQINLTAHNTLIQSNKIYLDSSSTVFSGKAFIPSAAIVSLDADKINTGTLNTQTVSIGDDQTRLWARSNHLYVTGKDQGDAYNMRICGDKIEFVTTEIPNNAPYLGGITPMYSIEYNGDSKARLKIRSFNRLTGSNEFPIEMYDSINIAKDQLDFAANNHMKMQVVDGGVNVRPTLFFQNNTNNGTWAGFTRLDNSDAVEFNTGNNNGENFHVNSGARFRQYLYVDGWLSCYQLKQTSLLSEKTDIEELDPEEALNMVRQDKQYLYKYKQDVQKGVIDQQAGLIIDDQNETPVYTPPKVFLDSTGKSREPNVELAYLIAAFQELDRRNQKLEQDIRELKGEVIHE